MVSPAKTFVNHLFMLFKTAQIHDPSNQAFRPPLEHLESLLKEMMETYDVLRLEAVETDLYLNGEKIRTDVSSFSILQYMKEEFENKNIGGLSFSQIPSTPELIDFVRLFSRNNDPTKIGAEELNLLLAQKGIHSIEFLERLEKFSAQGKDRSKAVIQKRQALKNYVKALDVIKESAVKIGSAQGYETRKAKRVVYNLVDICIDEGFSFLGLSNIKNYDEYTFNHSVNVCVIAIAFGKNLGLTKKQIGELGIAALFHDYGKLAIPKEILNKPGKFDESEWAVMKTHPLKSVKTLLSLKAVNESDIKKMIAAFEHHRNYDCSGYPDTGLKKPMNFYSKVVAIADAYDAMTTNRVYQRAMLPTVALKILMDNAGTKFDPLLVKAFVATVGIYPVGTLVRLNTQELAVVVEVNKDPQKLALPKIQIVANAKGNHIEQGHEIDLAEQNGSAHSVSIEDVLHPEDFSINVAHYLFADAAKKGAPMPQTSSSVH